MLSLIGGKFNFLLCKEAFCVHNKDILFVFGVNFEFFLFNSFLEDAEPRIQCDHIFDIRVVLTCSQNGHAAERMPAQDHLFCVNFDLINLKNALCKVFLFDLFHECGNLISSNFKLYASEGIIVHQMVRVEFYFLPKVTLLFETTFCAFPLGFLRWLLLLSQGIHARLIVVIQAYHKETV